MTTTDDDLWIRRFHPAPDAGARLVCLPHAGGSASYYHPVSAALSPAIDVLAVQYPGRQDRRAEPCVENIEELADGIVGALRPWTDRPFALFGHSMGAVLGFEVTRRLEREDIAPLMLFASGRRAPSTRRAESVHLRDDDGLVAELKRLNGTDSSVLADEELLRMVLPATRSDYRAIETYAGDPGAVLNTPITVLTGDNDPKTTLDEARAWSGHTTGEFEMRVYPGGHFFLTRHARRINAELTRFFAERKSLI
ncbi:alpha/beta fold hydrolase [Spongiactinospora sp. TRM90649]|uniref:thioesterase II family protein n=1 Tax=Spongiactinospora sp. TRM90649 TaxID=3031114 RepID=UPI0023F665EF|nr:alpha/beta fold hydrolase [Spongiactinospora sp. TRM90649]MDF5757187.1 alpha/beta fold hydrolase [Spongiactinospora sp. TRM90649]